MAPIDAESGRIYLPKTQQKTANKADATAQGSESFTDSLKSFMGDVNSLQKDSADMTERFIKGEPVDLHDVMIATEKAKTSFQLLMEMRNKFVDLYHEVGRIQV